MDPKAAPRTLCRHCKEGQHIKCNGVARQKIRNTGRKDLDWYESPCQCPCSPKARG